MLLQIVCLAVFEIYLARCSPYRLEPNYKHRPFNELVKSPHLLLFMFQALKYLHISPGSTTVDSRLLAVRQTVNMQLLSCDMLQQNCIQEQYTAEQLLLITVTVS